ncbi:Metallo-dependent phosphatase [Aureobasidium sp. EXF-10728]|nr:Metallo-dependent phosphatase [Aureobasidium sp. EXF-10728]
MSSRTHPSDRYLPAQYQYDNRPLIDRVVNNWHHQEEKRSERSHYDSDSDDDDDRELTHCCDLDSETSFVNLCHAFCINRKVRRAMFLLIVALSALFFLCSGFLLPAWREQQALEEGLDNPDSFGHQMPDKLSGIIQLQQLPSDYTPGGASDPDGKRRLIFIGDIHGCKNELLRLLKAVGFNKDTDKIVATGDVLAKGPDSPGVIDTLISLEALSVRGNHEDRILLAAKSRSFKGASVETDDETSTDVSAASRGAGLKGEALLEYLKPHHLKWLRSLPLIIHIPALDPPKHSAPATSSLDTYGKKKKSKTFKISDDINVVHAGLVPSVPLLRQDPFSVMNMRSMSPTNHVPSENRKKGIPWERVWGWYNDRISRTHSTFLSWLLGSATESSEASKWWDSLNSLYSENDGGEAQSLIKHSKPSVVVYGHDSPRGLNLKRWSKGLDSGCVNGDQLSAMVLDAWGQAEIVSVECKHRK